jgi:hypothetical protein
LSCGLGRPSDAEPPSACLAYSRPSCQVLAHSCLLLDNSLFVAVAVGARAAPFLWRSGAGWESWGPGSGKPPDVSRRSRGWKRLSQPGVLPGAVRGRSGRAHPDDGFHGAARRSRPWKPRHSRARRTAPFSHGHSASGGPDADASSPTLDDRQPWRPGPRAVSQGRLTGSASAAVQSA